MCLIAIKTRGAHLSENEIRHDFRTNPHGAGFMYADPSDHLVHWEKGFFNVDELINRWNEVVRDDMVAALHTRIATHGDHTSELCHPFPLDGSDLFRTSGSAPLVMMHNGIVPEKNWKKFEQNGDSDTSAFARRLTPVLNNELPDDGQSAMIDVYGGGSRFVFLNGDGDFVTVGRWHKEDGILFSNNHYHGRMSSDEWFSYGRERGFSTGYSPYSSGTSKVSYSSPLVETPYETYSSKRNEPMLFDEAELGKEDEIDVDEYDYDRILDEALSYGLYPVSIDDENGEIQGCWDDDGLYFIIDGAGREESINGSPADVYVYNYDFETKDFVQTPKAWYHFYDKEKEEDVNSYLEGIV